MSAEFSIGITTRDRWQELERTLKALAAHGLDTCETVVTDDGSTVEMPADFPSRFPWVTFQRSPVSIGYIAQRNCLARQLTAPIYLSLDDDSAPSSGDISLAAKWLTARPDVVALAFCVCGSEPAMTSSAALPEPAPVRFFIGCAHLLRREEFLRLGGYREELESYCEEFEFCVRAWTHGRLVMSWPSVVFQHHSSPAGRNLDRLNRLLTRNDLWIAVWHYPWLFVVLSFCHCLPREFRRAHHRQHWRAVVLGFLSALQTLPKIFARRAAQPWSRHLAWRRLPHPTSLLQGSLPQ